MQSSARVAVLLSVLSGLPWIPAAYAADKAARAEKPDAKSGTSSAAQAGAPSRGEAGGLLNLDFETGKLAPWKAEGDAFAKQPIKGDTVHRRRSDMRSDHTGSYWIGTFEVAGDPPQGTLTSPAFKVTQPFASFLVAGGSTPRTRVEIVRQDTDQTIYQVSGDDSENLKPVAVDLSQHVGKLIYIRLVDRSTAGWGHINFDDFRVHATKPEFPARATPSRPGRVHARRAVSAGSRQGDDRARGLYGDALRRRAGRRAADRAGVRRPRSLVGGRGLLLPAARGRTTRPAIAS